MRNYTFFSLILAPALCLAPALAHAAVKAANSFCTMEQATEQMILAADIDTQRLYRDFGGEKSLEEIEQIVSLLAEDTVREKLASGESDRVEIKWKDIYDVRGTAFMWACQQGLRSYCVGATIDAVGSGLTGTSVGRKLMGTGLALAGPPGYVMLTGMKIAERTFQCNPDGLAMLLDAGGTAALMLPWCKAPGVKTLCVKAGNLAGRQLVYLAVKHNGEEYLIGAAKVVKSGGAELVEVLVTHPIKHKLVHAAAEGVHSTLVPEGGQEELPAAGQPVRVNSPTIRLTPSSYDDGSGAAATVGSPQSYR